MLFTFMFRTSGVVTVIPLPFLSLFGCQEWYCYVDAVRPLCVDLVLLARPFLTYPQRQVLNMC